MATNKVTTNVIDMSGNTGGLVWTQGTTAQRPSGTAGELRLNTTDSRLEFYNGTEWRRLSETTRAPVAFNIEYLVVGGGGGGGADSTPNSAGGGGAGGYLYNATYSAQTNTSYTVTVGAGGSGSPGSASAGTDGSDSVFATLTAIGGRV